MRPKPPARRPAPRARRKALWLEHLEDRSQPASLSLTVDNPNLIENGPAATGTLTRTGDLSQALSVAIANSDTTEASAPASVTIPAGSATATFPVNPVDDALADGPQPVTLTATAVTGPLTVGYDTTFGGDGTVDTPALTGGSSINPGAVLVLADGTTVAAASTTAGVNGWAVQFLNPDGSTIVTSYTAFPGATGPGTAYAIARQPDGKILVGGDMVVNGVTDWAVARYNPDGGIDSTFGFNGTLVISHLGYDSIYDMAVAADGSILVSGSWYSTAEFRVSKISPTGSLVGSVNVPVYQLGTNERAYSSVAALTIGADGKIVLAGAVQVQDTTTGANKARLAAVARLNPDLSPDTSFGSGGAHVLTPADFGGNYVDTEFTGVAVLTDGRVVAGGTVWRSANRINGEFAAARFNADGSLDTSFAGDGTATLSLAGGGLDDAEAYDLAVQSDGRVVLAGDAWRSGNGTNQALARLTAAGDPDPSFNGTGFFVAGDYPALGSFEQINAIDLLPDGRLVAEAGGTTPVTNPDGTVTMVNKQWVARFIMATGENLTATANLTVADDDPSLTLSVSPATFAENAGAGAATGTVTRVNSSLAADSVVNLSSGDTTEATVPATVTIPAGQASATFPVAAVDDTVGDGTQAVTITASAPTTALTGPITYDTSWEPYGGYQYGFVNAQVAVAPDQKLVVAGTYGTVGTSADFGVYRYNASGTRDTTFGPSASGFVSVNVAGPVDQPAAVLVQTDGKIVVAGFGAASSGAAPEVVLIRLQTTGALDGTFGTGGIVRLASFGGLTGSVSDAALQSDGKILLSGNIGGKFAVIRLNANGTLDTTFNGIGWVTTDLSSATYNRAYAVAVAPDGKIVAAGDTGENTVATDRTVVVRYNPDGTPDESFGPGGVRETDIGGTSYFERAMDVVVQPDGKVVIADTLDNASNGSTDFAALRFNPDGTPDTGFATGGMYLEPAASAHGGTTRVILQTDGRIVVAGTAGTYLGGTIRGRFVRLSPAGVLENRADSAWTTSTTQSVAQDSFGNIYLAYNYGSSGTSGYVDRYKTVGPAVTATGKLNVLDNEPFAAVNDSYSATEETTLTVPAATGVRANDIVTAPLSGTSVTAELVAGTAHGTLTFNPDGSFTYTPVANFFGADAFTYRLRDGNAVSNPGTVAINVANVNDPPVAVNDSYTTAEDTPLTVSTAAGTTSLTMTSDPGDYIGGGRTYSYSPATGLFSVSGNATYLTVSYHDPGYNHWWYLDFRAPFDNVTLTPGTYLNAQRAAFRDLGHPGLDVSGDGRGSNTLTGQFTILQIETGANGAITQFAADFEQHSEGATPALHGSIRFNYTPGAGPGVLANDSDPDNDPLTVSVVTGPAHGQLGLNPDGTFTYTPNADYNGPDSFTYKANDGTVDSNVATVNLNVTAVNDPPVARDDAATTAEDTATTIDVVANDSDVEGAALKPTIVTQPAHGKVAVNAANQVVYTPAADFFGTDTFTYKATEITPGAIGLSGNVATVTVTVTPMPDPPVAQADTYTTNQGIALAVGSPTGVLANDSDPDGDVLTASVTSGPADGTLTFNPDGSFTYTPDPAFFGTDSFTYTADDGTGRTATATVTLTVVRTNNPPVARDDAATTNEDTEAGIGVITNDSDPDGDPVQAVVYTQAAHGMAVYSANDGRIYYTPNANFNGTDTFTYRAFDGRAYSDPATVTVTVVPVEDAPVAVNDSFQATEDTTLSIPGIGVLYNDSDVDPDPLTAVLVTGPTHGTLALNANGSFTYTPAANYNGPDSFTYQAYDGQLFSTAATVSITVASVNDPPVGNPDTLSATEDKVLAIVVTDLTGNDTDADGDTLSIGDFTQPAHGTLTRAVSFSGLVYTPAANYNGPDSFTYRPMDKAQAQGNVTTVTITVAAVNDAPFVQPDVYTLTEDTPLTVAAPGVLGNDSDVEGSPLTAALVAGPANGTVTFNADGSFTYTPRADYFGTDSFTYTASDGQVQSATGHVFLTVTGVNDAPVAADDSYTVAEDGILRVSAAGSVLDQQSLGTGQAFNAGAASVQFQQGVTAGVAGTLGSIDLFVYSGNVGVSFDVFINKGAPWQTDTPEAVRRVTLTSAMIGNWVTIDFSAANFQLAAGEVFTIGTRNGSGSDAFLHGGKDAGAGYPGGQVYFNGSPYPVGANYGYDLEFRTRMLAPGGILANDTDVDGDPLTAVILTQPAHGTLDPAGSGFTYIPAPNYNGPDSFTYKANDGTADSNTATVSINVTAVNDPPTLDALGDLSILEDAGTQTVNLSGITAGPPDESQPLTVTATSSNTGLIPNPAVSYTSPNATGTLTFAPVAEASGTATITVTVSDGQLSASRTFTVTVDPINHPPVGVADSYTVAEDGTLTAAGGPGFDQQSLRDGNLFNAAQNLTEWQQGVKAGSAGTLASFDLYVAGAPGSAFDVFVNKGSPWQSDTPEFVTRLTVTQAMIDQGWVTIDVSAADIRLAAGEDFTIGARNGGGDSAYLVGSDEAGGDSYPGGRLWRNLSRMTSPSGAGYDLKFRTRMADPAGVLGNDTDADGDSLAAVLVSGPAHGTLSLAADGGFTYVPAPNYNGPDSFTYQANDGTADSNVVAVSLTVTPVNDPPAAAGDTATTAEDTAVTVAVLANDTDVENDPLTVTAVTQGANGTVTFTASGVTYTPAANFYGTDTFAYTVSDGHGGTATGTVAVTVTAVNDPPTLDALGNRTIDEDAGTQTVNLTGITAGPGESQSLTVTATSSNTGLIPNPAVSYTSPASVGSLTFAPVANANGTATITVTVSDGSLTTSRQFTITVNALDDPPTLAALPDLTILEDAGSQTVNLSGITAGPNESGTLTVTATSSNPDLIPTPAVSYTSPNAAGSLTFAPAANASGTATITVTVSDGQLTASRTFAVTVTPVNDAPSFTPGPNQTVTAGTGPASVGGWATSISPGPADEAGQGLAFEVTTDTPGLFVATPAIDPATGTLTFIPEASGSGTATVTVKLRDTGGTANGGVDASAARTFTITVTPNGLPATPGLRMVGTELVITGADTADTVTVTEQGGSGKVRVTATLNGKRYNNQTFTGVSRIRVDAKGGDDTISFAGVSDIPTWTDAGAGNDTVTGGDAADQIYLGAGDDTASGGAGDDFIAGGAGRDLIDGGAGADTIYGGDDDDLVIGGPAVDQLFGQGGDDILVGGSAAVRSASTDSLRQVLTDWNPASTGVGGYTDIRNRLVVTDDAAADQLAGGAGTDWFWVFPPDTVADTEPGEQQN